MVLQSSNYAAVVKSLKKDIMATKFKKINDLYILNLGIYMSLESGHYFLTLSIYVTHQYPHLLIFALLKVSIYDSD